MKERTISKPEIAAIYFPSWHRDPHYEAWFGEGWNEWTLLRNHTPRFQGHELPQPAWGFFDEASPERMSDQIDLAADFGVNVFIFDWYWYNGVKILHRPLEEAFLQAKNRNRVKYALMWANHDWKNVFPASGTRPADMLLPIRHSRADFMRAFNECIQMHFVRSNYWRVDGLPFFSIFQPVELIKQLGGEAAARACLDEARSAARAAGLPGMHFGAFEWQASAIPQLRAAGFDSVTSYNMSVSGKASLANPIDKYDDVVERHETFWKEMDTGVLPYSPVVTIGWDTTARWAATAPFPPQLEEYPFSPVVVGNTPEKFAELCSRARLHAEKSSNAGPAIVVNAWNEWTEGSVLLPQKKYGAQYLQALRDAFAE